MSSSRNTAPELAEGLRERRMKSTSGDNELTDAEEVDTRGHDDVEKEQRLFGRTPDGTGECESIE